MLYNQIAGVTNGVFHFRQFVDSVGEMEFTQGTANVTSAEFIQPGFLDNLAGAIAKAHRAFFHDYGEVVDVQVDPYWDDTGCEVIVLYAARVN